MLGKGGRMMEIDVEKEGYWKREEERRRRVAVRETERRRRRDAGGR